MDKQQLASKIWQSANKMRSKIEANEYKDYILGFIFYKFLSDKELKLLISDGMQPDEIKKLSEDNASAVSHIKGKIGYFMAYKDLFSTWLAKGADFNVSNVRDALSAFNRHINRAHKKVFTGIFDTLQTGLSKLGDTAASQTKAISGLLGLIKDIPMDGKQDYDVLGFVYEYLISNFAANAGKKAGEFYTPHEVSLLMSEIVAEHLKDYKEIDIYDPTSGSGSLLINIGHSAAKHIEGENKIRYYAQELKVNTFNLTRMNLVMRGIKPDNIYVRNADTLEDDWPYFDEDDPHRTYKPLILDAVVSNPPYSQAWEPTHKEADPRYSRFGLAPRTKADFAFLLHDLYHLRPEGIMTIVLPHGVLFRGDADGADGEGKIRRNLIEQNHIDAIIGLPPNVFFGTGIATIIMVLRQRRQNDDVLFIDASKGFVKVGKNNQLRASDIRKIADTVATRADIPRFSRKVSLDEIRRNGYNLNIPRYVDSSDTPVTWDLYATMFGGIPKAELAELEPYWTAFPSLWPSLFKDEGTPYVKLATDNVKQTIKDNADVKAYFALHSDVFGSFGTYLKDALREKWDKLDIARQETQISADIFSRLEKIPLIDKYKAYQALNDEWVKTAIDLEIIQTEGFSAVKAVDPNIVTKKKGDVEYEVQDGWVGRIIPFALVQSSLLKKETDALRQKESRIAEIAAALEEIFESLTEENKEDYKEAFDDDGEYIKSAVAAIAKKLKASEHGEESVETKFILANKLFAKETSLKREIKADETALHKLTKETIEGLSDNDAMCLLKQKWVTPIVAAMDELPHEVIRELATKLTALADKYAVTYVEVTDKIGKAKNEVISLIDKLRGNEFDMKGLGEFQKLLRGDKHGE
ncbi:MAG: type I restriction-modification system subunit M [Holophagales bacterium]|jgi:type I restriction enzyme M protein|nr:type I restriction-modification system subunit M [Holophagales bacterium]